MLFAATAVAALFLFHCFILGGAVLRWIGCGNDATPLSTFYSVCLGMLVNMTSLFLLGVLGWFHLPAVGGTALFLFAAALARRRMPRTGSAPKFAAFQSLRPTHPKKSVADWLEAAVLLVIFLLCVAASLHPPGHWDDTMYHLPLARHYVEQQAIVLNQHVRFPLFPQNMNLLFSLGLMLGGGVPAAATVWQFGAPDVFAQLFATLPLFVIALGLWGASRRYMDTGLPGLLAGLSLFMIGPVKSTLGFAYVDNGAALFCWAAALAAAGMATPAGAIDLRSGRPYGLSQALLAGLLAGAACSTKYFGAVFAVWLGVVIFIFIATRSISTDMPGKRHIAAALRIAGVYASGVVLAGSAWYIRSYVVSGDPVHPAGGPILGFFLWNEGDLAFQHAEQATHGVGTNPVMLFAALKEAGVLLWLGALVSLFLTRVPSAVRVLQTLFVGYMVFWFLVSQVSRYLAPVYGVGGFLTFYVLYRAYQWFAAVRYKHLDEKISSQKQHAAWPAVAILLLALAYAIERGNKYGTEYVHAEETLDTNSGYSLYQSANQHVPEFGARLVQVGFENGIYFFRGTVIGDWFGPGRYRDIIGCAKPPCPLPPADSLEETLRRFDARMLLLSRQLIADLDEASLTEAGWQVLASNSKGVLLAVPDHRTGRTDP